MLLLQKMELAVGELAQILEQSQPRISRHIRILVEAGLAERRKEGSWVFLRPGKAGEIEILRRIFRSEAVVSSDQVIADEEKLASVREMRARMAEQYFAAHAEEWDAIRSLHLPESDVERAMLALLKDIDLGHLLDIGTGTGRMVELFAPYARRITALDKSPEMLRLARSKLLQSVPKVDRADGFPDAHQKTDIRLGDFNNLPLENGTADSVMMHQVLHYAQHPEAVLKEVGRVLAHNGTIMITDFAAHDREELRTVHAHARLGFADESIRTWFSEAGINLIQTRTLDGGALTVKIWVGRKSALSQIHPPTDDSATDNQSRKRTAL